MTKVNSEVSHKTKKGHNKSRPATLPKLPAKDHGSVNTEIMHWQRPSMAINDESGPLITSSQYNDSESEKADNRCEAEGN